MSIPVHEAPLARRHRGLVGLYGLWQFRDYLIDRGAATLIVLGLFSYLSVGEKLNELHYRAEHATAAQIAQAGGAEAWHTAQLQALTSNFLANFLGVVVFVGAVFATQGIVANDRKTGFYRFLFAKPVSPSRYYGQAFVIHWAAFTALVSAMALVYGALVQPILSVPLLMAVAVMFLMYAGIEFLASSMARWDWMSVVAVAVTATYLWGRFGTSPSPVARLVYLLPPLHRTAEVYSAVAQGDALPWHLLAWFGGYGLVCVVAALFVLRYRRLAII